MNSILTLLLDKPECKNVSKLKAHLIANKSMNTIVQTLVCGIIICLSMHKHLKWDVGSLRGVSTLQMLEHRDSIFLQELIDVTNDQRS